MNLQPKFPGLVERARAVAVAYWPADTGECPVIRVRRQNRGNYRHKSHTVTLPAWVFDPLSDIPLKCGATEETRGEYICYYIAHELCHALCPKGISHGPAFQAKLHAMVGTSTYRFERNYKPRMWAAEMARASGVLA